MITVAFLLGDWDYLRSATVKAAFTRVAALLILSWRRA